MRFSKEIDRTSQKRSRGTFAPMHGAVGGPHLRRFLHGRVDGNTKAVGAGRNGFRRTWFGKRKRHYLELQWSPTPNTVGAFGYTNSKKSQIGGNSLTVERRFA